jgi:poly-gamma-glutamate capsule biosynthesis protein CapA/YwtB (metallophosphatase superfamily)
MITFTGDLYLGHDIVQIENDVTKVLNSSEFIISNFENVLKNESMTLRNDKSSNLQFTKKAITNYLAHLTSKSIFSLGNNHIHDLGEEGLIATKDFLSSNRIMNFGAGLTKEVEEPFLVEISGYKVALIAASTDDPEVMAKTASKINQGVLDYHSDKIIELIEKYKYVVKYLIILPHWGKEYIDYPHYAQRKIAYKWIDAGADLIIGHHPHIMQGKEQYKGKWIYYSLGNYIFPDFYTKRGIKIKWRAENNRSVLVSLDIENGGIMDIGLFFDNKKNFLTSCGKTLEVFKEKTKYLNVENYPIKKYYKVWEDNYLENINEIKKKEKKVINKYFPENKDYTRIGYFLRLLAKKL